jgi:hypothetical protein
MIDYSKDYYEYVLDALKEMYQGYEDHYWTLVYSLQPYELIMFYEQVNTILIKSHPIY